ncbi:MAG: hypothetical protein PHY31_01900, partial [Smithellaceae bacterium]|nr:hypothetical protein [Smithellaceae bacterium]
LSLDGKVKAALIVNQSNLGVNLSELLNGITVIVNDPEDLPWKSLCTAISKLSTTYSLQEIPVLIYPFSYAQDKHIAYEKQYELWIIDMRNTDKFIDFMHRRFRMKYN